uniref:Uncharacterized protein n=1 Tax=Rhizophora mucronata TaxID=61149 RepID=A0A2P2PEY4_RHIMU
MSGDMSTYTQQIIQVLQPQACQDDIVTYTSGLKAKNRVYLFK